MSDKDRVVCY